MAVSKDKYLLLSVVCSLILIGFSFFDFFETDDEDLKVGIVTDVKKTANGYVFDFIDDSNETYSCFFKERPEIGSVYEIEGSFVDSNSMVFIEQLKKCQTS